MIQKIQRRTRSRMFLMLLVSLAWIPVAVVLAVVRVFVRDMGRSFRLTPT